jgi:hypothetical protein
VLKGNIKAAEAEARVSKVNHKEMRRRQLSAGAKETLGHERVQLGPWGIRRVTGSKKRE